LGVWVSSALSPWTSKLSGKPGPSASGAARRGSAVVHGGCGRWARAGQRHCDWLGLRKVGWHGAATRLPPGARRVAEAPVAVGRYGGPWVDGGGVCGLVNRRGWLGLFGNYTGSLATARIAVGGASPSTCLHISEFN